MRKYSLFILPILILLTACINRNFQQQKFTELRPIKATLDEQLIKKDTSSSHHQIADLIVNHNDSVYIQTEDQLLLMRAFSYDSSYQEICVQELMVVNKTIRKESDATIFIDHENLGNDNCFYISDADEIKVNGKYYRPDETQKKSFSSGYKSNLPEQSTFPAGFLVMSILCLIGSFFAVIGAVGTFTNADAGCSGLLFALFWSFVLLVLGGALAMTFLVLIIFFFIQLDQYLKFKKRK